MIIWWEYIGSVHIDAGYCGVSLYIDDMIEGI
jgi:hypothetical protein